MEEIRLQKYIADCGITSRRKAEELIKQGKIKVNGQIVYELGTKINPQKDIVLYQNEKIKQKQKNVYILLNKPIGYVTTVKDQFERPSVLDLVKVKQRVVPVGRLDMYTSGALILTNDGDFVYQVTHPKHEIDKTYTVTIKGIVTAGHHPGVEQGRPRQRGGHPLEKGPALGRGAACIRALGPVPAPWAAGQTKKHEKSP